MHVRDLMRSGDDVPRVGPDTSFNAMLREMTGKGLGFTAVADDSGGVLGIFTDGDLRRHFAELCQATAREVMTVSPKTVPSDMLAADVLLFLNDNQITTAFVVDRLAPVDENRPVDQKRPVGIVHIHDCLRAGVA